MKLIAMALDIDFGRQRRPSKHTPSLLKIKCCADKTGRRRWAEPSAWASEFRCVRATLSSASMSAAWMRTLLTN